MSVITPAQRLLSGMAPPLLSVHLLLNGMAPLAAVEPPQPPAPDIGGGLAPIPLRLLRPVSADDHDDLLLILAWQIAEGLVH